MSVVALGTWIGAVLAGLYLLTVWLMEYDREYQLAAASRLPVPILGAHALLAVVGLVIWAAYLLEDSERLAQLAAWVIAVVAILGLTLAMRWIAVYRAHPAKSTARVSADSITIPPERNFPLPVVIGHGVFAVATLVMVVLTALRIGGS